MGSWDMQTWPDQNMQWANIAHNLASSLLATLFLSIGSKYEYIAIYVDDLAIAA